MTSPTSSAGLGGADGDTGLLAVDRIMAAYLGATGLIAAWSLRPDALLLALAHALAAGLVLRLARRGGGAAGLPGGGLVRFLRLFYPVLLTPLLYHEVSYLGQLHVDGYFDATVQGWEETLFGVQLSAAASRWLPWTWFSELLHLGYVSYYLLVPGAALAVHLRGTPRDLHRTSVTVAGAFFVCYLIFALFPVMGPRYLFPTLEGAPAAGPVHDLTHWILTSGSAKGTAFPSSHVAAAVGAWLTTRPVARSWYRWTAPLVWLLVAGTVYGGFHYAVDSLAGLLVAGVCWRAAPVVCRSWGRPPEASGAPGPAAAAPPGNPETAEGIQRHG